MTQLLAQNAPLTGTTDILTVTTTGGLLYPGSKKVRKAIIQNNSSTDTITLVFGTPGAVSPIAAGSGILLNPAPSSGQGGGSFPVGNGIGLIDIGAITAITSTNTNQTVTVYSES